MPSIAQSPPEPVWTSANSKLPRKSFDVIAKFEKCSNWVDSFRDSISYWLENVSSSDFVILSIENTAPCWFSVHNAANHRRQKAERRSSGAFCRPSEFALLGRTSFGLKLFIFIEHCFCRFENMPSDILHVFVGHFHYWISVNKPVFLCNNTMLPTLER